MDAQSLAGLVYTIPSIEVYIRLYRCHISKSVNFFFSLSRNRRSRVSPFSISSSEVCIAIPIGDSRGLSNGS